MPSTGCARRATARNDSWASGTASTAPMTRARILKVMCQRLNPKFYDLASKVEETALTILHEEHPERPQATNVEFYSAGVLQAIGLPKDFFPPTFAVSRVAGWSAHVLEQASHNRLIRPQSEYVGPQPRKPVPLAERG